MSDQNEKCCLYCDNGDIEFMRNNGYINDEYVFCEINNKVMPANHTCQLCSTVYIKEKKEARMDFLIKKMADALR